MGKIYVGQTDLTIKLETGKDLTGITDVQIHFRNPSGIKGYFPAIVVDMVKGIIAYSVISSSDISVAGEWVFWAKVTDSQGLVSAGESFVYNISKQGY